MFASVKCIFYLHYLDSIFSVLYDQFPVQFFIKNLWKRCINECVPSFHLGVIHSNIIHHAMVTTQITLKINYTMIWKFLERDERWGSHYVQLVAIWLACSARYDYLLASSTYIQLHELKPWTQKMLRAPMLAPREQKEIRSAHQALHYFPSCAFKCFLLVTIIKQDSEN